tara:strand:+ start:952 stop:1524 length:573 start_codon:yes stop_codon:yes gene_type:complete
MVQGGPCTSCSVSSDIGAGSAYDKKNKPALDIQYDASIAYEMLRKSGKLLEPEEGIVPFRIGVSNKQFWAVWSSLDGFDFEPFYELQVGEIYPVLVKNPLIKDINRTAATEIFLMKLITADLVDGIGRTAIVSGVKKKGSRVDGMFVRSDTREFGVSKYILDAFEGDEAAISEDTVSSVVEFMRGIFRPI